MGCDQEDTSKNYLVLVDGFCKNNGNNNAIAGGSYVVYETPWVLSIPKIEKGDKTGQEKLIQYINDSCNNSHTISEEPLFELPTAHSNNAAEALSLLKALSELNYLNILNPSNKIVVCMDSELTINQLKGIYKINNTKLMEVHRSIRTLLAQQKVTRESFCICYIPGDVMKKTKINH